ncbi:MAG: hypothetical protein NUV31_09385 [Dehalococcoidales bacterium]|jgi:hypothetical protein|nr:hypothetical protein [Dehalococcoidales bacterium]
MSTSNQCTYEVLSPWAEADPVPVRGLTAPRLNELEGKKIGLYRNDKRAAGPILSAIEKKLKERFPNLQVSWYTSQKTDVPEFDDWLKSVDAVVAAVGD